MSESVVVPLSWTAQGLRDKQTECRARLLQPELLTNLADERH